MLLGLEMMLVLLGWFASYSKKVLKTPAPEIDRHVMLEVKQCLVSCGVGLGAVNLIGCTESGEGWIHNSGRRNQLLLDKGILYPIIRRNEAVTRNGGDEPCFAGVLQPHIIDERGACSRCCFLLPKFLLQPSPLTLCSLPIPPLPSLMLAKI